MFDNATWQFAIAEFSVSVNSR